MARVKDEMVASPIAATVPATGRDLLALFLKHGHAGFPVVKEGHRKLVGLVTRQDIFERPDENQVALLMDPNPPTTYPEASVSEAARVMVDRRLRLLPVVTGSNDLVGIVTARELLRALPTPHGHVAPHLRRRLVPAYEGTPACVALEAFRLTRTLAIAVLDANGRFVGILTDANLLAKVRVADATVHSIAGMGGDGDEWAWEGIRDRRKVQHATARFEAPKMTIGALAGTAGPRLGPNAPLSQAVDLILDRGLHEVAVVDDEGRLLDVVNELDVLAAAVRS